MVTAADNIAETTPFLLTFSVARGSAKSVFAVIYRISKIDPISKNGEKITPANVNGEIQFKNVHFSYPSRPDTQVQQSQDINVDSEYMIDEIS